MPTPHTIRLNGPWELISPSADRPQRVKLPGDWPVVIAACEVAPVVLQRWFHRPTGLDEQTVVQLVLSDLPCRGSLSLNEVLLGEFQADRRQEFDVTAHLSPRGCLTLSLASASPAKAKLVPPLAAQPEVPAPVEARTAPAPIPEIALTIQPRS